MSSIYTAVLASDVLSACNLQEVVGQHVKSPALEVQTRACEYAASFQNDEIRPQLFEHMPALDESTYSGCAGVTCCRPCTLHARSLPMHVLRPQVVKTVVSHACWWRRRNLADANVADAVPTQAQEALANGNGSVQQNDAISALLEMDLLDTGGGGERPRAGHHVAHLQRNIAPGPRSVVPASPCCSPLQPGLLINRWLFE
jgi:hypothetical protein